jgi:dihydrofolate synthase / folylpolyglutamate synthase
MASQLMTYKQTLAYFYSQLPMFHRVGAAAYKADLNNTKAICKMLGNPEKRFRSIHIAGTNGKGSTSHMLASILMESGLKTGLFTSPHLKDFRERIIVNGRKIPKREVTQFIQKHRLSIAEIEPSFFEMTFGLAAWWFAQEKVEIAVIETGMGGRLDSTNVIIPELSIITNIGYDHMQFLGNTLEAIAAEKAGIIKEHIPLIIGESQPETLPIFNEFAKNKNTKLYLADQNYSFYNKSLTQHRIPLLRIDVLRNGKPFLKNVASPLSADYQLKNILTVLQSVELLRQKNFKIGDNQMKAGIRRVIKNTKLKGRWQTLSTKPLTIADIGHNADGIREVVKQLKTVRYEDLHFVLGVVNDKDVYAMLKLLPVEACYYFCKADIPRGLDAAILAKQARSHGLTGNSYPSVRLAFEAAKLAARANDLVFVGGSAFVVAEAV